MKLTFALLGAFVFVLSIEAKEPAREKKERSTVPGPYPSIIKIAPAGDPGRGTPGGIIQSELGGREMLFLQSANRAGQAQLALAELAKGRSSSEQIKSVAEMFGSTQLTENKAIARLAAEKHVTLGDTSAKALTDEIVAQSGAKFEKAWIERLIAVSELGAAAYELGAESGDAAIRSFAEKMLPIALARVQMANRLGGRSVAAKPAESEPRTIPPLVAPPAPAKP